jgi:hypothetical protein
LVVRVGHAVSLDKAGTVVLSTCGAQITVRLEAADCLGAHANTVTKGDVFNIAADLDGFADDLRANTASYTGTITSRD